MKSIFVLNLNFFSLYTNIAQTIRRIINKVLVIQKMSDHGEHYNTLFITETHGRGFGNNTPITFNPICRSNTEFIFAVKNPDTKYSKSVWARAPRIHSMLTTYGSIGW